MIFTSKRNLTDSIDINIDGHKIEEVVCTKFLGVYIDNKLSWKKHIEHVSGKVSRGLGIILKARHLLNPTALKTLYFSFVYPYFSYCNHVWGSSCSSNLNRLFLLQKRAIRVISSAKFRDHTDPIFKRLGLLKLSDINKYAFSRFMYRWYHSQLPKIFNNSFNYNRDVSVYRTRQSNYMYLPQVKTNLGKTRFLYRGPLIWNGILSAKINPDVSEATFSKSIKQCIKVGLI